MTKASTNKSQVRTSGTQMFMLASVRCVPLHWRSVADEIANSFSDLSGDKACPALDGIWCSQIGKPRDELKLIATWPGVEDHACEVSELISRVSDVTDFSTILMKPTLRPAHPDAPQRQGNYAFRWFETPSSHWEEFLDLCERSWPGFESAYDSQVIGLWRVQEQEASAQDPIRSLLLTRRPNLATWERSKIPQGAEEIKVRHALSRRYDLCNETIVFTTTLLTALDDTDNVRWT